MSLCVELLADTEIIVHSLIVGFVHTCQFLSSFWPVSQWKNLQVQVMSEFIQSLTLSLP